MDLATPAAVTTTATRAADAAHFKQYELLLHKLACKMLPRALAVEPSMEHEDVFQMLAVVYAKCKAMHTPERGQFSTYLQCSCQFEFNDWMDKRQKERRCVSPFSLQSHHHNQAGQRGGSDNEDIYDRIVVEQDEMDIGADPAEAVSLKQQIMNGFGLSPDGRKVVAMLLNPTPEITAAYEKHREHAKNVLKRPAPNDIHMKFVCDWLGISAASRAKIRVELREVYGVDFRSLPR